MTQDAIAANLAASSASESESDGDDAIRFKDSHYENVVFQLNFEKVLVKSFWHSSFTPPNLNLNLNSKAVPPQTSPQTRLGRSSYTQRSPRAQRARSP
jgi:hypothetical protein